MQDLIIRTALENDLVPLGTLAMRSKAHWGYDSAFMDACRDELAVPRCALDTEIVRLCRSKGALAGFYRLERPAQRGAQVDGCAGIEAFFVDPQHIGSGVGKAMWIDLLEQAAVHGVSRIICQSDPHAEGFYVSMGMQRTGALPSASIPGRKLPVLELTLTRACG